jgi:hypothetical protein
MREIDSQFASPRPEKYTSANGVGAMSEVSRFKESLKFALANQMADPDLQNGL